MDQYSFQSWTIRLFKYFNFFIDSWIDLLGAIGYEQKSTWTLNVILPVGISFYTFQTMSYSLDIYHGKLKPTKDFISFASFVSFFHNWSQDQLRGHQTFYRKF